MTRYQNPLPTVDIAIQCSGGVVLVERKNPPFGWALPGGFVESGESLESAALRESNEETGLDVRLQEQFFTYSDPKRDPRRHTITTVYLALAEGIPTGGDDAVQARVWSWDRLPEVLCFDHGRILHDLARYLATGCRPRLESLSEP